MMFLWRSGSRHGFDTQRNCGAVPENVLRLCGQTWDPRRLGPRRTVTGSDNAVHHAARVPSDALAAIPVRMIRRLMAMRLLERGRLFGTWWRVVVDGTLQDRGRKTRRGGAARHRYVLEAKLLGPCGTSFPLMTEFLDVRDWTREKEDCELRAFARLARRLKAAFPRLPICLLMDALYAVQPVFTLCDAFGWKYIVSFKEGRQPTGWDEAVQTMLLSPENVLTAEYTTDSVRVQQMLRWTEQVAVGKWHVNIVFLSEVSPKTATLWAWATNLPLRHDRMLPLVNAGGKARQNIENDFNVQKNGGFGLEHAFCANATASRNLHLVMQIAHILWQLLADGVLRRMARLTRKPTDLAFASLLRASFLHEAIPPDLPQRGQIRFPALA